MSSDHKMDAWQFWVQVSNTLEKILQADNQVSVRSGKNNKKSTGTSVTYSALSAIKSSYETDTGKDEERDDCDLGNVIANRLDNSTEQESEVVHKQSPESKTKKGKPGRPRKKGRNIKATSPTKILEEHMTHSLRTRSGRSIACNHGNLENNKPVAVASTKIDSDEKSNETELSETNLTKSSSTDVVPSVSIAQCSASNAPSSQVADKEICAGAEDEDSEAGGDAQRQEESSDKCACKICGKKFSTKSNMKSKHRWIAIGFCLVIFYIAEEKLTVKQ